jgi:hypothetical protein
MRKAHMPSVTLNALILIAMMSLGGEASLRSLLLGWTGAGKTYFCNRFDGTNCPYANPCLAMDPRPYDCATEMSDTSNTYVGKHLIDVQGIGENRFDEQPGSSSVRAVNATLRSVDGLDLRAVIWVTSCGKTIVEELKLVKLVINTIGKNVPLVAVFNPGYDGSRCWKHADEFIALCAKWGINVRKTYIIDHFEMDSFEQQFYNAYRVVIPPNLNEILLTNDPEALAARLLEYRNSRCTALPAEIKAIEDNVAKLEASKPRVPDRDPCPQEQCPFVSPAKEDCTYTFCAERGCKKKVFGICVNTDCVRYETIQKPDCIHRNNAATDAAKNNHQQCLRNVQTKTEACQHNNKRRIDEATTKLVEISARCALLEEQKAVLQYTLRSCDQVVSEKTEL